LDNFRKASKELPEKDWRESSSMSVFVPGSRLLRRICGFSDLRILVWVEHCPQKQVHPVKAGSGLYPTRKGRKK